MRQNLEALTLFTERYSDLFVEFKGELFFVGDESDLEQLKSEGFEFEEGELEITPTLSSRRNVGCKPLPSGFYSEGYNLKDAKQITYNQTRVINNEDEDSVLSDSDFIILRQLKDDDPKEIPDHVIFDREQGHYYCMSNVCTTCDVIPVKVSNQYCVTSSDISAQEPMVSTLVSREPKWAEVFELNTFRKEPDLLYYLDTIVEDYLNVSKRDRAYVLWVHNTYFYERSDLYKLNFLVEQCKSEDRRQELKEHIQHLIDSFNGYRETLDSDKTVTEEE